MKWYEGNIAEAVNEAKASGAVFGVIILGEDDRSKELEISINSQEVQNVINEGKFLCIRLIANSQSHQQFAQIYSNAPSPSIYLIGEKGLPLETVLVSATTSPAELKMKFVAAWSKHSAAMGGSSATSEKKQSVQENLAEANEAVRVAEEGVNQTNLTLEEKIERAQRLAAAKRKQKAAEEAEELKRKEFERRDMGKGLAELKRRQDEIEAKKLIDERRKDKLEAEELKRKIKEQIAADRAARNARTNVSFITEGPHPPPTEGQQTPGTSSVAESDKAVAAATPPARNYNGQARIQFRLPAGALISHGFDPVLTLGDVRNFLINNNHVPFRPFTLSIAYPRRQFTDVDYSCTLRDLGLLPSAALLILPMSGSTAGSLGFGTSSISNLISLLVKYLMIPFTFLYSLMQRALTSSGQSPPPTSSSTSSSTSRARPPNSSNQAKTSSAAAELRKRNVRNPEDGNKTASDGKIHRLRDNQEDSDEDATYNGNSTQQM